MYSIKEISDLAGVSTRTLRYYDEIHLLPPAKIGQNGYRLYDEQSLLRLQQIMFFRELDVPLKEIAEIIHQPDFDLIGALRKHRQSLKSRAKRLDNLITTLDNTIESLKGARKMAAKEYFEGFDEAKYAEEVQERWGDSRKTAESLKKWSSYTEDEKNSIKEEGGRITRDMVGEDPNLKPDDPNVQKAIGEYLTYLNTYFYTCDAEFLRCLSAMWVEDARFAQVYDGIREGGAKFVREAVQIFCDNSSD